MSIQSANIFDLLSMDGEEAVLPTKTVAKDSKVEQKATAPKQSKEHEKKQTTSVELGKGNKTQDKPKRPHTKPGGGGDRPPREKPANPNKRVFDRRSGTGRGKENKKGGAGKGNWGSIESKDELTAEGLDVSKTAPVDEPPKEPIEVPEEKPVETTTEEAKPEEEEDKTLSYEEWKAKNEVKVLDLPVPVRQAGEGVDHSAWAEYVPLAREPEETIEGIKKGLLSGEKKKKEANAPPKVRVDEVFKIQVAQQDKPAGIRRGGSRRGGRDSPKSFRGGRGGRTNSGKNFSLNEEAFPSLSTKA